MLDLSTPEPRHADEATHIKVVDTLSKIISMLSILDLLKYDSSTTPSISIGR